MIFLDRPAEPPALPVLLLLVAALQAFECLNVLNGFKCFVEVVDYVSDERFYVLLMSRKQSILRSE